MIMLQANNGADSNGCQVVVPLIRQLLYYHLFKFTLQVTQEGLGLSMNIFIY